MADFKPLKIRNLFQALMNRLPSTYPKAKLIIHSSLAELRQEFGMRDAKKYLPYAYCNKNDTSIHISPALIKESTEELAWYLLHELGHLYAFSRYGGDNPKWNDHDISERYANLFAWRWVRRLKKEEWFKTIEKTLR